MKQSLISRGVLILAITAIAVFMAFPPSVKVKRGLDLQGGMHLVLEVKTDDAIRSETNHDADTLLERLAEDKELPGLTAQRPSKGDADVARFTVSGVPSDRGADVRAIYKKFLQDRWDLAQNGADFVFAMRDSVERKLRDEAVGQARRTIRNRIDQYGVSEPVIQRQGFADSDRLVLQLPGVEDPERVKSLIGRTAFLEWKLAIYPRGGGFSLSREDVLANLGGSIPADVEILEGVQRDLNGNDIGTQYVAVERRPVITGRDLKTARVGPGQFNEPVVIFVLDYQKGQEFGEMTKNNIGRGMAVVLDNRVLTAPTINGQIFEQGNIQGSFDPEEAADLATSLKSGALPAEITFLEERTVGPSLGQDSVEQGLRAGLLGAGLVVVAMLIIYLLAGVNAILVLTLNIVFVFGALAAFGATLTLPGIAGIILTIGMAVDANVLIFERIREELRAGRTVKAAVASGFGKALSSIIDANVTTLIAAVFLFQFGTGPIRGFAVTLSIGILASVFTAVFVSRWVFDLWLSRNQRVERLYI